MKDEYANYLLNQFDYLFSTFIIKNKQYACKQFSVGDGWYALLFDLCAELSRIISDADDKGRKVIIDTLQIKEKFGGLRFYKVTTVENESWGSKVFRKIDGWVRTHMCKIGWHKAYWAMHRWRRKHIYETLYEKVGTAVSYAESKSYEVCEFCAAPGERCRPNFWILTLCENCKKKEIEKHEEISNKVDELKED